MQNASGASDTTEPITRAASGSPAPSRKSSGTTQRWSASRTTIPASARESPRWSDAAAPQAPQAREEEERAEDGREGHDRRAEEDVVALHQHHLDEQVAQAGHGGDQDVGEADAQLRSLAGQEGGEERKDEDRQAERAAERPLELRARRVDVEVEGALVGGRAEVARPQEALARLAREDARVVRGRGLVRRVEEGDAGRDGPQVADATAALDLGDVLRLLDPALEAGDSDGSSGVFFITIWM